MKKLAIIGAASALLAASPVQAQSLETRTFSEKETVEFLGRPVETVERWNVYWWTWRPGPLGTHTAALSHKFWLKGLEADFIAVHCGKSMTNMRMKDNKTWQNWGVPPPDSLQAQIRDSFCNELKAGKMTK